MTCLCWTWENLWIIFILSFWVWEKGLLIMKGLIILILSLLSLASCGRTDVGKTASDPVVYGLEKPVSQNDAFSYVYGYMLAASASGYADTIDYHYMA